MLELADSGKLEATPIHLCPHDHANKALLDLKAGRITGQTVLVRDPA